MLQKIQVQFVVDVSLAVAVSVGRRETSFDDAAGRAESLVERIGWEGRGDLNPVQGKDTRFAGGANHRLNWMIARRHAQYMPT